MKKLFRPSLCIAVTLISLAGARAVAEETMHVEMETAYQRRQSCDAQGNISKLTGDDLKDFIRECNDRPGVVDGSRTKTMWGTTGVEYSVYEDGSGSFAGERDQNIADLLRLTATNHWQVGCSRDSMNDQLTCHLKRGDFWLFVGPKSKLGVSIGTDNFPGRSIAVRIGQGESISTTNRAATFDAVTSQRIVAMLEKQPSFKTRFVKWPYESWIDGEYSTYGFSAAFEYVKQTVQRGNRKSGR